MNVHETVASLRAERLKLADRLAVVDQVLAGLDELFGVEAIVGHEPAPTRRPPRRIRPAAGAHMCEVCGRSFNRPNGLSRHLHQTHGIANGRSTQSAPAGPIDTSLVLHCGQCGWEVDVDDTAGDKLTAHCRERHDRSPLDRERRPRSRRPFAAELTEVPA